jgi:phosphatidate cytidylyltransferase
MKSFLIRAVSALIAISILYGLFHFLGNDGIKLVALIAVVIGAYELVAILFNKTDSKLNRTVFYLFIVSIFLLSTQYPRYSGVILSFFSICFCLVSLLTQKKFHDLVALTSFQAKSVLGFMYVGLLPSFAVGIVDLPHGTLWFLTLLGVVFAGDTGAYLVGMMIGKKKLMPMISPKKTVEGALGGLFFSTIMGILLSYYLNQPAPHMIVLSLAAGIAGQFGDLFESQLKRVAAVKDSGTIMPGHGGVLDRIDGVLFASPIIYFGAIVLEHLL